MEAIYCSETSVDFQRTARRYIPEDCTLYLGHILKFPLLLSLTLYVSNAKTSLLMLFREITVLYSENNKNIRRICGHNAETSCSIKAGAVYSNGIIYRQLLCSACSLLPSPGVHWNHFHSYSFTCGHFHAWIIVKVKSQSETACKSFFNCSLSLCNWDSSGIE
jgi:hypothetical protein